MGEELSQILANVSNDISYVFSVFLEILVEINTLSNTSMSRFTSRKDGDWIHYL